MANKKVGDSQEPPVPPSKGTPPSSGRLSSRKFVDITHLTDAHLTTIREIAESSQPILKKVSMAWESSHFAGVFELLYQLVLQLMRPDQPPKLQPFQGFAQALEGKPQDISSLCDELDKGNFQLPDFVEKLKRDAETTQTSIKALITKDLKELPSFKQSYAEEQAKEKEANRKISEASANIQTVEKEKETLPKKLKELEEQKKNKAIAVESQIADMTTAWAREKEEMLAAIERLKQEPRKPGVDPIRDLQELMKDRQAEFAEASLRLKNSVGLSFDREIERVKLQIEHLPERLRVLNEENAELTKQSTSLKESMDEKKKNIDRLERELKEVLEKLPKLARQRGFQAGFAAYKEQSPPPSKSYYFLCGYVETHKAELAQQLAQDLGLTVAQVAPYFEASSFLVAP